MEIKNVENGGLGLIIVLLSSMATIIGEQIMGTSLCSLNTPQPSPR